MDSDLRGIIGYLPGNAELFTEALTHGSHGGRDYQRLEFLGDRVLGMVIANSLYAAFPAESEGQLSARLNALVTRECCAEVARAIGLPAHVRLGKQALSDGGRESENIIGDVMEAIIGAIWLDAGLSEVTRFITEAWASRLVQRQHAPKHPKSALLEWSAANRRKPPVYTVISRSGPDHAPIFTISAAIAHAGEATATGTSKQDAETAAAASLLAQLTGPQA